MSKKTTNSTKIMVAVWALIMVFAFFMYESDNYDEKNETDDMVLDLIKPIGEVEFEDVNAIIVAESTTRSAKEIYLNNCQACHNSGALGAPKFGSKEAWEPLIKRGIENILKTAISGVNAMPAKGGCNDCSDEEIKSAIQYIIDNSN